MIATRALRARCSTISLSAMTRAGSCFSRLPPSPQIDFAIRSISARAAASWRREIASPWRNAFWLARFLPTADLGPVLLAALRRLAARFVSEVMTVTRTLLRLDVPLARDGRAPRRAGLCLCANTLVLHRSNASPIPFERTQPDAPATVAPTRLKTLRDPAHLFVPPRAWARASSRLRLLIQQRPSQPSRLPMCVASLLELLVVQPKGDRLRRCCSRCCWCPCRTGPSPTPSRPPRW